MWIWTFQIYSCSHHSCCFLGFRSVAGCSIVYSIRDLDPHQRTRCLAKHRGCMGSRSASYPHTSRSIYKPIFLIHPLLKKKIKKKKNQFYIHATRHMHYSPHTIPATHAFPSPSTDQAMTTVVARSDCKVSDVWVYRRAYMSMIMCTCLIRVRMDVLRT